MTDLHVIQFSVFGTPIPQGSIRSFRHRTTGAVISTSDNKRLRPWRQEVAGVAMEYRNAAFGRQQPLVLCVDFFFKRPRTASRQRTWPVVRPDVDKALRGILDALSGILYVDDAQVVKVIATKVYGEPERAEIRLQEATAC